MKKTILATVIAITSLNVAAFEANGGKDMTYDVSYENGVVTIINKANGNVGIVDLVNDTKTATKADGKTATKHADDTITFQNGDNKAYKKIDGSIGFSNGEKSISKDSNGLISIDAGKQDKYDITLNNGTIIAKNKETGLVAEYDFRNDIKKITTTDGKTVTKAGSVVTATKENATLVRNLDGTVLTTDAGTVTYDQDSGTFIVNGKEVTVEEYKQYRSSVDPIENEPTVPTRGEFVNEKKAEIEEKFGNNVPDSPVLGENGQGQVVAHSQAAQAQTQAQIDELYAIGNQNASDIDTLFSEVDRLDTRIDQTQALNAATVNARPMVTNGMTAFGAGVGYAGSEAALAIGVAHSFEDTGWSASGTVAASSDDSVLGAGVQYAF